MSTGRGGRRRGDNSQMATQRALPGEPAQRRVSRAQACDRPTLGPRVSYRPRDGEIQSKPNVRPMNRQIAA